jgi:hypothetical protein
LRICRHGRVSTTKCDNPEKQTDADKFPPIIVPASIKKQQDASKSPWMNSDMKYSSVRGMRGVIRYGYEQISTIMAVFVATLWPERSGTIRTAVSIGAQRPKENGTKMTLKGWSGAYLVNLQAS